MRLLFVAGCFVLCVLAGCSREAAPPAAPELEQVTVSPTRGERFELAWQGVLPCADCSGIETRLLLHRDGARRQYELRETYLGGGEDAPFVETGVWRETTLALEGQTSTVYELGEAPGLRRFRLLPDGGLLWLDSTGHAPANRLDYRLQPL